MLTLNPSTCTQFSPRVLPDSGSCWSSISTSASGSLLITWAQTNMHFIIQSHDTNIAWKRILRSVISYKYRYQKYHTTIGTDNLNSNSNRPISLIPQYIIAACGYFSVFQGLLKFVFMISWFTVICGNTVLNGLGISVPEAKTIESDIVVILRVIIAFYMRACRP